MTVVRRLLSIWVELVGSDGLTLVAWRALGLFKFFGTLQSLGEVGTTSRLDRKQINDVE